MPGRSTNGALAAFWSVLRALWCVGRTRAIRSPQRSPLRNIRPTFVTSGVVSLPRSLRLLRRSTLTRRSGVCAIFGVRLVGQKHSAAGRSFLSSLMRC
ncbi:hypothetical protein D9M68_937860 [compost metagenome]